MNRVTDVRPVAVRAIAASGAAAVLAVLGRAPNWWLTLLLVGGVIAADTVFERVLRPDPTAVPIGRQWHDAPPPKLVASAPIEAAPYETSTATWFEDQSPLSVASHPPPVIAPEPPEMPPLVSYLVTEPAARHPQCPSCGRFDVAAQRAGAAYAFECRRCGSSWPWMTGSPWPVTRPRPDLSTVGPEDPTTKTGPPLG